MRVITNAIKMNGKGTTESGSGIHFVRSSFKVYPPVQMIFSGTHLLLASSILYP